MRDRKFVSFLFVGPALLVVGFFLFYPTLVTTYTSFLGNVDMQGAFPSGNFVGVENYVNILTSGETLIAFRNTMLWIVVMTAFTIGFGLILAVLLDRVQYESIAKSLIFMPMAVSFTAASVIWKFVYAYRPPGFTQIGLLNALLGSIGDFASQSGVNNALNIVFVALGVIASVIALLSLLKGLWRATEVWKKDNRLTWIAWAVLIGFILLGIWYVLGFVGAGGGSSVVGIVAQVLMVLGLLSLGIAALRDNAFGPPLMGTLLMLGIVDFMLSQTGFQPTTWLLERPWTNNLALIVMGIWVWTGFAMVMLSAAYKGIPKSMLEAARVDGANELQVFWHVTIPYMKTTIIATTTTIVIFVLKIFDFVWVTTNGEYGTDVLASLMIRKMYSFYNYEVASALAVVLFVLTIPFVIINIRRFQRREAIR
ncbi:sugar ABC transporter permease [Candidatus Bipolaricaulota bacterium]|nr:sugar ABC transporter permease [Candidatus Bipolaricaulota bacterium]